MNTIYDREYLESALISFRSAMEHISVWNRKNNTGDHGEAVAASLEVINLTYTLMEDLIRRGVNES